MPNKEMVEEINKQPLGTSRDALAAQHRLVVSIAHGRPAERRVELINPALSALLAKKISL
jgi:hypothetical protein